MEVTKLFNSSSKMPYTVEITNRNIRIVRVSNKSRNLHKHPVNETNVFNITFHEIKKKLIFIDIRFVFMKFT